MFTKWLKNIRWKNTRVRKGFFEEKMANLKVFIANVSETYGRQHFIHENLISALKYVVKWYFCINFSIGICSKLNFSIEICSKMILIGNYTCSRSINEKSHLCLAKYL